MQRSTGLVIAFIVGLAGIAAPICASVFFAQNLSLASEQSQVQGYANDVLRRSSETAAQFGDAINELNQDKFPLCSPQEIDLMREIDLASNYIQAVGRISGDSIICTSLDTKEPIPLGPPTLVTENGVTERTNIHLSIARSHPLSVLSKNGVAVFIDPSLVVDTPTEGTDVSIAVFPPSDTKRDLIAFRGNNFPPNWFRIVPKGTTTSFIDGEYLVAVARSKNLDVEVIAAAPRVYIHRRVKQFAIVLVPIGLLCGLGLAWAVTYIAGIHLSLPSLLRAAARRKEFYVEYQPIVELASRRWIGAEALVRWKRRGGKAIGADQFIPVAEESGVITHITREVAAIVATDLPKFLGIFPNFRVAINLSVPDIKSNKTIEVLERMLQSSGADASNIEIEVTERGIVQGSEAHEFLSKIRSMGIRAAIDDFGTGYSSLASLQTLDLDTLKIDKAFVETIGTGGATSQVVLHIIEMAHSLELEMVAEGVETEAQAQFLHQRGVRYAQGWLFGKPMSIETFCESLGAQEAAG